jgi:hypothetical protein
MLIGVAVAAVIGSTSLPGRTLVAWLAVAGALYYGLASMAFPSEASSLGFAGGALALAAALAYAFGAVTSGRTAPAAPSPAPRSQPVG